MPRFMLWLVLLAFYFGSCESACTVAWSQSPRTGLSQLLRPEYYDARDFYNDGQIVQAMQGFEVASSRSRSIHNEHGIDNVPPLVMLGMCKYQQGLIAEALSSFDLALDISIRADGWIDHLQPMPGVGSRAENRTKEALWADAELVGPLANTTSAWPCTLGSNEILLELNGNEGVVGKLVAIDALEIIRCQAIAIRMRNLLLGPLTPHHPMSANLVRSFSRVPDRLPDLIARSRGVCLALAESGAGKRNESEKRLERCLVLENGMIHPLSALGHLAVHDLAVEKDDMPLAHKCAVQASIAAARTDQMDLLVLSIEAMSSTACAMSDRSDTFLMMQRISEWTQKRGRLTNLTARIAWLQLHAARGESVLAKEMSASVNQALQQPNIFLPRLEAMLVYIRSQDAFRRNALAEGIASIEEAVLTLQNDQRCTARVYQVILTNSLTSSGSIPTEVGLPLLAGLLFDMDPGWARTQPLDRLAFGKWMQFEGGNALSAVLEWSNNVSTDEKVKIWDAHRAVRFRRNSALYGKLLETRLLLHSPGETLPPHCRREQAQILSSTPAFASVAKSVHDSVSSLVKAPKWDRKKWTDEEERQWSSATRFAMNEEAIVWQIATGYHHVPNFYPPPVFHEVLKQTLHDSDAIVFLTEFGDEFRGFLWRKGKWTEWNVLNGKAVEGNTLAIHAALTNPKLDLSQGKAAQKKLLENLEQAGSTLLPAKVAKELEGASRWIIIPDSSLWMLPFEMFGTKLGTNSELISSHRICYSPTVGVVPWIVDRDSQIERSVFVHDRSFFSRDQGKAARLGGQVIQAGKGNDVWLEANASHGLPSNYLKVSTDRVVSLSNIDFQDAYKMLLLRTDVDASRSRLATWTELPWGVPQEIWLPGMDAHRQVQQSGDDWLKLTLPLIAQGNRSMLLSRWPVGGESTASFLRSLNENRIDMSLAASVQLSVLRLWEESWNPKNELVVPTTDHQHELVTGKDPRFWAGYLSIGDAK